MLDAYVRAMTVVEVGYGLGGRLSKRERFERVRDLTVASVYRRQ